MTLIPRFAFAALAAVAVFLSAVQPPQPSAGSEFLLPPPPSGPDARIDYELQVARAILRDLSGENLFRSPFLVSAVFYSHGLYGDASDDMPDVAPARRILGRVSQLLGPDTRARFIKAVPRLHPAVPPAPFTPPVAKFNFGRGRLRQVHPRAIDLFAPEGTPVRSASDGVVLLAESGWKPGVPLSTSTGNGGNTVIVYDPAARRFYRYGHLETVSVSPGVFVEAGTAIATVGHTGNNASRRGHGEHLHFEINEFDGARTRALTADELRDLLEPWASKPAPGTTVRRASAR